MLEPTISTGVAALVAAALTWLAAPAPDVPRIVVGQRRLTHHRAREVGSGGERGLERAQPRREVPRAHEVRVVAAAVPHAPAVG